MLSDERIIELAKQTKVFIAGNPKHIITFAQLIAAETREECANVCDELETHYSDYCSTALLNGDVALANAASGEPRACRAIAEAIRSQGK